MPTPKNTIIGLSLSRIRAISTATRPHGINQREARREAIAGRS